MAGSLEMGTTPLNAALQRSFLAGGAAPALLDAGADVNGLGRDGITCPLCAAACASSDASVAWLLERGASLTLVDANGRTIAHAPAVAATTGFAATAAEAASIAARWLRRVAPAEPSLLEARDGAGHTPLETRAATAVGSASPGGLHSAAAAGGGRRGDGCRWLHGPIARLLCGFAARRAAYRFWQNDRLTD
jgi:hypothetical protein